MRFVHATMQGGDVTGIVEMIGFFLVKAGGALIDNMAILFVIGVGVGMADDNDGTAGLAASSFMVDDDNTFFPQELLQHSCQQSLTVQQNTCIR